MAKAIKSSSRSHDLDNLLRRISGTEHKLTVLHGVSGVGKSSLVTAGLVPALLEKAIGLRNNQPVLVRQYTSWQESILESLGTVRSQLDVVTQIFKKLDWNEEHNVRTVLIFDQFEEFFFVLDNRDARQEFYRFLGAAIGRLNVKVILSMREDYLHYLLECRKTPGMERVNDGDVLGRSVLYEIGNFSPNDARLLIEDLTTRSQFTLETTLIDRLVADLAEPFGEVRPIELQIAGAQLQTNGIRTLAEYPVGGKAALVDQYLMEVIGDCGKENERLASLTAYLLTDERKTRPLKTRSELELELEMEELLPEADWSALDLVLAVFVGSGLVLRESGGDRFQLVHDYLAGVIRDRYVQEESNKDKSLKLKAEILEKNLRAVTKESEHKLRAYDAIVSEKNKAVRDLEHLNFENFQIKRTSSEVRMYLSNAYQQIEDFREEGFEFGGRMGMVSADILKSCQLLKAQEKSRGLKGRRSINSEKGDGFLGWSDPLVLVPVVGVGIVLFFQFPGQVGMVFLGFLIFRVVLKITTYQG